ncbi:MAG: hypothetical protein ACXVLT_05225 [Flavisolibacter sp.]
MSKPTRDQLRAELLVVNFSHLIVDEIYPDANLRVYVIPDLTLPRRWVRFKYPNWLVKVSNAFLLKRYGTFTGAILETGEVWGVEECILLGENEMKALVPMMAHSTYMNMRSIIHTVLSKKEGDARMAYLHYFTNELINRTHQGCALNNVHRIALPKEYDIKWRALSPFEERYKKWKEERNDIYNVTAVLNYEKQMKAFIDNYKKRRDNEQ